ncbi:MAG: EamA family transporter [Clostridia bacterium]|nr:EamA family transporter [Clostridia bacterium]
MKSAVSSKLQLTASMLIFSSIGIFVKYIPMPSSIIACARGLIGMIFLLLVVLVTKNRLSRENIKNNLLILLLSGAAIGFNWIFLFEAYNYTTVATATLTYYLAPFFVMLASPFLLKEKLTLKQFLCLIGAIIGMVFVSGVVKNGIPEADELKGILFGLGAAILYASVIILNKKLREISAYEKTVMQLGTAAVVVIPYIFLTEDISKLSFTPMTVVMLLITGIVHTGIAYALYFNSMKDLKAQTVAIFSYIDPAVAILLSAFILKEGMDIYGIIGAVLILGSAMLSEVQFRKKLKQNQENS